MASQRASITKELLRESLESVLKPFKIHALDDGKFSCVLEFLMGCKVFVNRPTGSATQLVVSNIRLFSRINSPRARCEESIIRLGTTLPDTEFNWIVIYRILDILDSSKFKHKSWEYYCQCSLHLKFKQNMYVFPLI